MIATTILNKAGIITSRLAFGTSRLHYLRSGDRQRLLSIAAETGFLHFDTAPVYGDGLAEAELGIFLRKQRKRFVIATKYGLPPDPFITAWPSFARPLRVARAILRRAGLGPPSPLPSLTERGLRASVEQSLRRLGTDYIDLLLLHEPRPERIPAPGEIFAELTKLRKNGVIRAFGVAGSWEGVRSLLAVAPELGMVIQTGENEWPPDVTPDITYGAMATGPQRYFSPGVSTAEAAARLREALMRRPHGVVVVSTTKRDHLNLFINVA